MNVKELQQIEQAVIGTIVVYGPQISRDELSQEDFESPIHYQLYELAFQFWAEEKEALEQMPDVDRISYFSSYLASKGLLEKYQIYLPLLAANAAPPSVLNALVDTLKKQSKAKKLKELAKQIASSEIDIEQVLPEIERTITQIKETKKSGLRKIDILSFMTTEPPKLDFVFNSLPASSIGILASPGGLGKSMFVLELLTAIATGRDITEGAINTRGQTGKCTYLSLEDPEHVLHYRI